MEHSVAIVRCQRYDDGEVLISLRRSIDLLGGIETFIKRGDRVLLKPNLLYGKVPEKAVTTHPAIIRGMIQIVREAGGNPFVGDSPSIGSLSKAAEKAGIRKAADEMGCPMIEFDKPVVPDHGGATFFKKLEIDQCVLDADVVINLPKWKTHGQMFLTLGVKNLFGCIPGAKKALWHLKAGDSRRNFARVLIDLYQVIRPSLTILDGILGMEGNGPGSGHPISLGLILASRDALSLDQVVCDLLSIPRKSLPTNRVAFEQGLGKGNTKIVGQRLEEVRISQFQFPMLSDPGWNLPGFLKKALKNALSSRPAVVEEVCQACGRCEEICPTKALKRKGEHLAFDYRACIRCFCCLEVCPEGAITMVPGWASRLVGRKA
jgi:uncharacterized protein (DUF362 family)/Pyruvate/2-oxoacid:ferredoxin oxidoreductase delta subunit